MKIHIIADLSKPTDIIPRLFSALSEHAHFTISDSPDSSADVNYWSLYLLYPKEPYTLTKTCALFSHYETNVKSKADEWKRVAQLVDLRLTWSKLYYDDLIKYGKTVIVNPFIDRDKFNFE
jgi:hypothetical protein